MQLITKYRISPRQEIYFSYVLSFSTFSEDNYKCTKNLAKKLNFHDIITNSKQTQPKLQGAAKKTPLQNLQLFCNNYIFQRDTFGIPGSHFNSPLPGEHGTSGSYYGLDVLRITQPTVSKH